MEPADLFESLWSHGSRRGGTRGTGVFVSAGGLARWVERADPTDEYYRSGVLFRRAQG